MGSYSTADYFTEVSFMRTGPIGSHFKEGWEVGGNDVVTPGVSWLAGFFDCTYILDPSTSRSRLSLPFAPRVMDPPAPVIYLLPTRLTSDELRQWGERAASITRVTQVAGEADFIVGKSTLPPFVQASFLPNAQDEGLPHKPLSVCTFR